MAPTSPRIESRDVIETCIGRLELDDGIPSAETAERIYDQLDFTRGVETFFNALPAVSLYAMRRGFLAAGVRDGEVLIFSRAMDAASVFLTASADAVCFMSFLDLRRGPLIVDAPFDVLATIDDMWFRWIIDTGAGVPNRGEAGRYVVVPPHYAGPLPETGAFIARSRTSRVFLFGRALVEDGDARSTVSRIRRTFRAYPYLPGSFGVAGERARESAVAEEPLGPRFVEGTGRAMTTIPPNDFAFYEMLHALVQEEPADALDRETAALAAAIGIVKGAPFTPNARLRRILTDAAAVGDAASRTIGVRARDATGLHFYPETRSTWSNPLFVGCFDFMTPLPGGSSNGDHRASASGAWDFDARSPFLHLATVLTPAAATRETTVGSQYLGNFYDVGGVPLDGGKHYRLTLPPNVPAAKLWSLTVYDRRTRSMLQSSERAPCAGSQRFPGLPAEQRSDGSVTIHFAPEHPGDVPDGNWIRTLGGRGWFVLLRLYSPLPAFFDKSWRPGEIEEQLTG